MSTNDNIKLNVKRIRYIQLILWPIVKFNKFNVKLKGYMKTSISHKVTIIITLTAVFILQMTTSAFATTTYLMQVGTFTNADFINTGVAK